MAETVNLPRDSTLRELVAVQKASIIASGNAAAIDRLYGSLVRAAKSVEEVNTLFVDWWNICWKEGVTTRNELCGRWFGTVLDDNRVHGTKEPLFATSQSAIGEATDDSVGLVCTPSTEAAANRDDFAKLPQFWALEVAAEKNADGTHTIYAVEFIDSYDDVRRSKHLCWVLQKNTYTKEWDEGGYRYFKMRCHPSTGYEMWPQGTDKNGTVYGYIANPKYAAGFDSDGLIGCGSGRPPINYSSHSDNVGLWRKRGAQYAGASGRLLKWQLAMIRLKYARKGKPIKGRVTRARIVTDHSDRTWEWGYYVCVQLDADQTPDAVNFMYFCHCSRLLVDVGDRVISGQQLAIMGETGNAEGTHPHCHFEVRATASGKGLDPTAYAAIPNKAGIYGAAPAADKPAEIPANSEKAATSLLQNITVGPVSSGDATAVVAVCKEHGTTADSYTNAENHLQIICIRSVVQAVADAVLAVCKERKLTDAKLYTSHWA